MWAEIPLISPFRLFCNDPHSIMSVIDLTKER